MVMRRGRFDRWRVQFSYAFGPGVVGLVICALTVWAYQAVGAGDRDVLAHVATTHAVIERIGVGVPQETSGGPPGFSEYGNISYLVGTRALHGRVTLQTCSGVCPPRFRVGQTIRVAYDVRNVSALYYPVPTPGRFQTTRFAIGAIGAFFGVGLLFAAAVNLVVGTELRGQRTGRRLRRPKVRAPWQPDPP
jgi:hypothetical protein